MSDTRARATYPGHHGLHLALGSLQGFLGMAMSIPTGIISAIFLARVLGPADYGLLTVTVTIVSLMEFSLTQGITQSAIKLVSAAPVWQTEATRFAQTQLIIGIGAALLLIATAPGLAALLRSPALSEFLRIYAIAIPISALATIHQAFLTARERFRQRAVLMGTYWLVRLVLVVILVTLHRSINAVIWANICAFGICLIFARCYIAPPILKRAGNPFVKSWHYTWPLFFFSVGISLFRQMDLIMVLRLCESPSASGFLSATKNLTIVPGLAAAALSPLLLAKVSKQAMAGDEATVQNLIHHSLRFCLLLIPVAALAAMVSSEVVTFIYGSRFLPAGDLLQVLIFGALGTAAINICVAVIIATGHPGRPILIGGPMLLLAAILHPVVISRWGVLGAAWVTTLLSLSGAVTFWTTVLLDRRIKFPCMSLVRTLLIAVLGCALAKIWPATGFWVLPKLAVISTFILVAYFATGELRPSFLAFRGRPIYRTDGDDGNHP